MITKLSSSSLITSSVLASLLKNAQDANVQAAINLLSNVMQAGGKLSSSTKPEVVTIATKAKANASALIGLLKKEKEFTVTKDVIDSIVAVKVFSAAEDIKDEKQRIISEITQVVNAVKSIAPGFIYDVLGGVEKYVREVEKVFPQKNV